MQTIYLGKLGGLTISMKPNALIGLVILWALLATVGIFALQLSTLEAVLGSLVAAFLHFIFELVHQFGHATAARRTGHPMIGVRFWWVLGQSIYPSNEPELPPAVHIRRALGGPIISLISTVLTGIIAALLNPSGGVIFWVALFVFLDNLLVFTLGALMPLGFTDGSTLLRYWGKS